ncbi:1636_t:CDS:2 [Racocetra fulgida]|uniref:1636_t:CDS:1 n=1 Tax=Racocetra fulgida TaxID=60492 RepID=A0A9N8VR91_9GLOM|nr:1636_t:CDS:2 [Racocetra fulgida]
MKEKEKQHDSNIKGPELLPNGRVKCNHPCKDKQKYFAYHYQMKSQPVIHDEYGFLDQSWFETWNEFDLISIVDLDEDRFSELPEMAVGNKKDANEELVNEENEFDLISIVDLDEDKFSELPKMTTENKEDADEELMNEEIMNCSDEMKCKTFTEALDVFDYVLRTII